MTSVGPLLRDDTEMSSVGRHSDVLFLLGLGLLFPEFVYLKAGTEILTVHLLILTCKICSNVSA